MKSLGAPTEAGKREGKKSRWTKELCMRYAKRFGSIADWKRGAPASFKAASACGWVDVCVEAMPKKAS